MASKHILLALIAAGLGTNQARAQDGPDPFSGVICPNTPTQVLDFTGGACPRTPPAGSTVATSFPANTPTSVMGQRRCKYTSYAYVWATGQYVTSSHADLIDPVECIPYFWGQWWNQWGHGTDAGTPNPVTTDGMDGTVIHARIDYPGSSLNLFDPGSGAAASACAMLNAGVLWHNLTSTTCIGGIPEWSCPCVVTTGENCPDGLWAGLFGDDSGLWGTIYATGQIYPDAWQTIEFYAPILYITTAPTNSVPPIFPIRVPPPPANPPGTPGNPPGTPPGTPGTPTGTGTPPYYPPIYPPGYPGIPGNGTPGNGNPINPTNNPEGNTTNGASDCTFGQQTIPLDVPQWLNLNYDQYLQIQQVPSQPPGYPPLFAWSSPSLTLYGGITQGYATCVYDNNQYPWLVFSSGPVSGASIPSGGAAQQVADASDLLAISGANGPNSGMTTAGMLLYGMEHYPINVQPISSAGHVAVPLPASSPCITIVYQFPTPTGGNGALNLDGTVCEDTGSAMLQTIDFTWSSSGMTNLTLATTSQALQPYLPTNVPCAGEVTVSTNFALTGPVEVTVQGVDCSGVAHSLSRLLLSGMGLPNVTMVTNYLTITNTSVLATWKMDITTTSDPNNVTIMVYQNTNYLYPPGQQPVLIPTPLFAQQQIAYGEYQTPTLSPLTYTASTTNSGPLTLVVQGPCGSTNFSTNIPQSLPPQIFVYSMYQPPGVPVPPNATPDQIYLPAEFSPFNPCYVNPGTVIYMISNTAYSPTNVNSPPVAYALYSEPGIESTGIGTLLNYPAFSMVTTPTQITLPADWQYYPSDAEPQGQQSVPGQTLLMSGTFYGPALFITNDVRDTILQAYTVQPGNWSPTVTNFLTRITVETPLVTNLPPVLYNDTTVYVTNWAQLLNAMVFQYITFEAMLPMFPGDPTSTNFTYPSQPGPNFLNPDDPLSAGVIAIFLGGNNQTALDIPAGTNTAGSAPARTSNTQLSLDTWLTPSSTDQLGAPVKFWTNMLQNASLNEHWYPYTGDLAPWPAAPGWPENWPGFYNNDGPIKETMWGLSTNVTMFNVGAIAVQWQGSNLIAGTATSNASITIVQETGNGVWATNAATISVSPLDPTTVPQIVTSSLNQAGTLTNSVTNRPGTAIGFANVDNAYPTELIATRLYYNPAVTNIPATVIFEVDTNCDPIITINHAITNLFIGTVSADGTYAYQTLPIPSYSTQTTSIRMGQSNGTYIVYAQPMIGAPLNIGVTLTNAYTINPVAQGGTIASEPATDRYLLIITNFPVTVSLNPGNQNTGLIVQPPWEQGVDQYSFTLSTNNLNLASTLAFATTNLLTTLCSTNEMPIDVVINVYNTPPFQIPVSTPSTNNCTNFEGGGTPTLNTTITNQ